MLGRLKHACSEYMISTAAQADLNECLLYLRLAHKYQLSDVEDKVLQLIQQRSVADIMACTNYDITFAAALILRRAQWLEEKLSKYKNKMKAIRPQLSQIIKDVNDEMSGFFSRLNQATNMKLNSWTYCSTGSHTLHITCKFDDSCHGCASISRKQFKEELSVIYDTPAQPEPRGLLISYFDKYNSKVLKLQQDLTV